MLPSPIPLPRLDSTKDASPNGQPEPPLSELEKTLGASRFRLGVLFGLIVTGLAWWATFTMWEDSCISNAQQFIRLTNVRVQSHTEHYVGALTDMGARVAASQFSGHISFVSMTSASRAVAAASLRASLEDTPNLLLATAISVAGDVIVVAGRETADFGSFSLLPSDALIGDPAADTLTKYTYTSTGQLDMNSGTVVSTALTSWVSSQSSSRKWGSWPEAARWGATLINNTGGLVSTLHQPLQVSGYGNTAVVNIELSLGNLTELYFGTELDHSKDILTYLVDSSTLLLASSDADIAETELVSNTWTQRSPADINDARFEDTLSNLVTAQSSGHKKTGGNVLPRETSLLIEELVSPTVYGLDYFVSSSLRLEQENTVLVVITTVQTTFVLLIFALMLGHYRRWKQRKKEKLLLNTWLTESEQGIRSGNDGKLIFRNDVEVPKSRRPTITSYGMLSAQWVMAAAFVLGVFTIYAWIHTLRESTEGYAQASTYSISQGIVDSIEDVLAIPAEVARRGAEAFRLQEVAAPLSAVGSCSDTVDTTPLDAYMVSLSRIYIFTEYIYLGLASTGAIVGSTHTSARKPIVNSTAKAAARNLTQQNGLFEGVVCLSVAMN